MILNDLKLLGIKVYEEENLIFEGNTQDIPDELKEKQIKIMGEEEKIILIKLDKEKEL